VTLQADAYLILEPVTAPYSTKRITGAKVVGVRQNKPALLEHGQRVIEVVIEIPDGFFDPPRIEVVAAAVPESDTPESVVAKMQGLVAVRAAFDEHLGDQEQGLTTNR
jgi:hypothetical protein